MPLQIWSQRLQPGDMLPIIFEGILYLKQISLVGKKIKDGKTTLKVIARRHRFTLCTLSKKTVEQQTLSHQFIMEDHAALVVEGTNAVQLVCVLVKDTRPLSDEDDAKEDEGESMDEEEEAQQLIQSLKAQPSLKQPSSNNGSRHVNFIGLGSDDDDDDDESSDEDYMDTGFMDEDGSSDDSDDGDDYMIDEERETITGAPRYANYLSDLLGADLPDDDDDDDLDDEDYTMLDEGSDEFGSLAFRDPNDTEFLGGFELRHFNLAPDIPGFEKVDLRSQEDSVQDTHLNDNIARGLVNALLNSGDEFQVSKGKELLRKLKKQMKQRKAAAWSS